MIVEEIIALEASIPDSLLKLTLSKKKLAIFGVGQGYLTFKTFVLDKFNISVDLFIDIKFNKAEIVNNVLCINPKKLSEIDVSDYNVVITTGVSKFKSIQNQLNVYFGEHIYSAFEFYEYHLAYGDKEVVCGGYDYYLRHSNEIQDAYVKLFDQESKIVFRQILELYMTRQIKTITHRNIEEQYLSKDVGYIDYSRTISCGAFDGDTFKNITKYKGKLENIVLFEPDLKNFQKLSLFLNKAGGSLSKSITALPLAVGDKIAFQTMSAGGTNSNISDNGDITVMKVAIDDIYKSEDCSFLNMDIEGGELEALVGAQNLIRNCRPSLAISIYHQPKDLWRICLFLDELNLNYKFFIRNYTGYPAETLLYATTSANAEHC